MFLLLPYHIQQGQRPSKSDGRFWGDRSRNWGEGWWVSGTGLGELFQKLNICKRPSYKNISLVKATEGSGDDGAAGLVGAGELLQVQPSSAVLSLGTTQ